MRSETNALKRTINDFRNRHATQASLLLILLCGMTVLTMPGGVHGAEIITAEHATGGFTVKADDGFDLWFDAWGEGPGILVLGHLDTVHLVGTLAESLAVRRAVAGRCEAAMEHGIHTYVDDMDDAVNEAYAAWPTRLYLVGLDGRVVYASGLGPFGFKPAELGVAIEEYLARVATQ